MEKLLLSLILEMLLIMLQNVHGQILWYILHVCSYVFTEELPLALIIGGAVGGIGVIFIIVIACVVYHKFRHSDNGEYQS